MKESRMLDWLTRSRDRRRTARSLYGSIVTRARQRVFYEAWGVPDTLQGRFEMVVLHLALVLGRLRPEGADGERLARALNEEFVIDVDDCMREMTFGDLRVPREMKRATAALFDRHNVYLAALRAPGRAALRNAIAGELAYLDKGGALDAARLADDAHAVAAALAGQPREEILGARLAWPDPLQPSAPPHSQHDDGARNDA